MDPTGIATIAESAKGILGMFFPDKTEEEKAKIAQAMEAYHDQQMLVKAQIDANAAASANGITFRDGAGWVCVAGFAVTVLRPLVQWGTMLAGHPVTLPAMDTTEIMPLLMGLLGLGGMHLYEQVKS